ncbi:hypothetical protein C4587_00525 [Candidatus Parcubacteria bacterium]|nr:MAG: hypothetical protein C4587_00525 [Candidatus Parcubacteria bacterium]
MKKSEADRRGQFLVEALIALGVLVVGLLGILTLLARSFFLGRVIADNYTATYLAAEGVEVVKNLIDANYIQGRPFASGFSDGDFEVEYGSTALAPNQDQNLLFDAGTNLYGYAGSQATKFRRVIRVALIGVVADEVQVNSIVSWTTGGGSYLVDVEGRFLNWRP